MFTFGFSYVGVIYLLMLFIPNIIWTKNQPKGYTPEDENKVLAICERIGQALCTCLVLIFDDFNIHPTRWIIWLEVSFLLMVLYEVFWIRYFKSKKTMSDYYKPMFGIKVPGASLPVVAFLLLGIYGTNIFLILGAIFLGIGHIGIHMGHYNKTNPPKDKTSVKVIKTTALVFFGLILAAISFFIGARNINYFQHYRLINKGVDEGIYVELGGQEQYLLIRGADKSNPVIVFLHGGPSSPESYVNYAWVNDIVDDYTVIDWDQRGCGRTYEYNSDIDPNNDTATFEQAIIDLDELVDYARDRFNQEQVIIIGHSYGTVLASSYTEQHPEKVSSYVAMAQVVSMELNNHTLVDMAIANATENGKDTSEITAVLNVYDSDPNVANTMELRNVVFNYLPEPIPESSTWLALTSPYMGMPDFMWFLKQLQPMDVYFAYNTKLYNSLLDFDLYNVELGDTPVTYISGSLDYACPVSTIEDYISASGVNGTLYVIDDCGHNVQYTKPHEVSEIILNVLGQ